MCAKKSKRMKNGQLPNRQTANAPMRKDEPRFQMEEEVVWRFGFDFFGCHIWFDLFCLIGLFVCVCLFGFCLCFVERDRERERVYSTYI